MSTNQKNIRTGLEIAITGMSARFPGAGNVSEFWKNLVNGVESLQFFSEEELLAEGIAVEKFNNPSYVKVKGIIEGTEYFDATFFGFTPKEANKLDPQIRLCCSTAYEALEDAGIETGSESELIGVFLGASPNLDWQNHSFSETKLYSDRFATLLMNDKDFLSTRISYLLNLTGPSVTVYTACSTSLVAVEMACQALLTGKCDTALVGAVSLSLPVKSGYFYEPGMIMSKDGHTCSFDENATGSVFSDGIGMIVLKRLEDAEENHHTIHAIIRGIGINNDGAEKIGYTAPGIKGQSAAISMAHQLAGIDPSDISYIEAHGSGTLIGDQIEIEALNKAFINVPGDYRCPVGSVKSNFGHLNTAAGMAGLIKTVLMLKNKCIPASLNHQQPIPVFSSPGNRFYVNTKNTDWKNNSGSPLYAGVSSFGIGGTNVHVILEEAPDMKYQAPSKEHYLLSLAAKTPSALERMTAALAKSSLTSIADVAYTLHTGRNTSFDYRRALVCDSIENAIEQLNTPQGRGVITNTITGTPGPLLFMLPGIGAQYRNMGIDLYENESYFRNEIDQCFDILDSLDLIEVRKWLYENDHIEANFEITQTALFVFEYSLSRLLIHWGLKPQYLVGYSLGELVAACLAGVFTIEQALRILIRRGKLINSLPAGLLLSVPLPAKEVRPLLTDGLFIAIDNGPSCIVTGSKDAVESFSEFIKGKRLLSFIIPSSKSIHSLLVQPILEEFRQYLATIEMKEPVIPFLSNVTGNWITCEEAVSPDYWCKHLSQTVLFADNLQKIKGIPDCVAVEVGPGNDLSALLQRLLPEERKRNVISTIKNASGKKHDRANLLQKIGQLWTLGYKVNWKNLYEDESCYKISLPVYPFEKTHYPLRINEVSTNNTAVEKYKDISKWFYVPSWKRIPPIKKKEKANGELLVFDKNGLINEKGITVEAGEAFKMIEPGRYTINPTDRNHYSLLFQDLAQRNIIISRFIHAWPQHGFYSLLYSLQELEKNNGLSQAITINVVTRNIFVVTGEETINPAYSTILGLLKVIPQEYPGIHCRVIEIEDKINNEIRNDILSKGSGEIIAWRGNYRWQQDFAPVSLNAVPNKVTALRKNGTYLITGGHGRIGKAIATFLQSEYNANLILISRTKKETEFGENVIAIAADVADVEAMKNAVSIAEEKFGTIHGVIHAAGIIRVNDFKNISAIDRDNVETHSRSKIEGSLALYEIFKDKSPDFVLMASSLSPILGGVGLAAYAAANQFMDSLCGMLSAKGLPWISLNWADWKGWEDEVTGMIVSEEATRLNISLEEGIETLRRVLHYALNEGQVAISAGDLLKRMENWVKIGDEKLFEIGHKTTSSNKPLISAEYVPPSNDIEKKLVELWEDITGFTGIGVEDDFTELGGDSLKAVIMLSRARKIMDTIIPLGEFFRHRTIRMMEQLGRQKEKRILQPIPAASGKEIYTLSSEQRRLFYLREFDESGTGYNETHVDIIEGPLDIQRMESAFKRIIDRHEIYRTAIIMTENGPVQEIKQHVDFNIKVFESTEEVLPSVIRNFSQSFNFSEPPFLRIGIVKLFSERHALIFDRHHIVSDGISSEILYHDLIELYEGRELPPLTLQYKDYAEWQQQEKQTPRLKAQAEFWKKLFASSIPLLELPIDFPRPAISNFEGGVINFNIDEKLTKVIREICALHNITVHNLLLSVFNIFLSKISAQEDIVVGTPVAARRHPDLDPIIGIFVNTLPLRNYPQKNKLVVDFIQEVKEQVIDALENQEYPYEDMVEQLAVVKDPSRNPLFDVMFVYQNLEVKKMNFRDIKRKSYPYDANKSKVDLNLVCWDNITTLDCNLEYSSSLFKHSTVDRFSTYFINILLSIITAPQQTIGEIDYLPESEKRQLLYEFNSLQTDIVEKDVLQQLIERQVQQTPDAIAIVDGDRLISYDKLNMLSNQLAHRLRKMDVQPDDLIGLFTDRSASMIIAMLGILKAGGAYLPIDPALPISRINYIIKDSGIKLLLCDNSTAGKIDQLKVFNVEDVSLSKEETSNPVLINQPSDLVYAIYTSGSTGNPKGILLEHRNAVNLVYHCINHTGLEYDRVLQFSTISFDVSFSEIFYTLCSGGSLYLVDEATRKNIPALLGLIEENKISTVFLPMSLLQVLFNDTVPTCIRHIQTAGEQVVINEGLKKYLQENNVMLHNHYGPAETHVVTTLAISPLLEIPALPSIGFPIINTPVYILDSSNKLVPVGVTGELCAGGAQVGRGYLGKEELTKEKFIKDPFRENERIYKTGDLAKWNADGSIEFLGRADRQVKIRGYRVELGEVEQCLAAIEGIKQAVVDLQRHTTGEKYLCAYLVSEGNNTVGGIRKVLLEKIPDYMVPTHFFFLESIPVTPHGKIDRNALPAPGTTNNKEIEKPVNEIERSLRKTWALLLSREEEFVGTTDNFFEAGGHSLKAMQLLMLIQKEFRVRITLREFFKKPTIQSLAESIRQWSGAIWKGIVKTGDREFYPTTSAQKRLYFLTRLNPKGVEYNITYAFRVEGKLDVQRLNKAIKQFADRHEILRTRFGVQGNEIVQAVERSSSVSVEMIKTNEKASDWDIMKSFIRPFDLHTASLFRVGVTCDDHQSCILLFDFHHIIWDGVSFKTFVEEIKSIYNNDSLSPVSLQFKDYACWQETNEYKEWMDRQEKYWLKVFTTPLPAPVELPLDFARPRVRNYEGDSVEYIFDEETTSVLREFIAKEGVTSYALLLSAFNVVLSKLTNRYDIIVGSPVSGRREAVLADMPGMFVNTIALRNLPVPQLSFSEFLREVMQGMMSAFENQEYPFELLVNKLNQQNNPARNPLFDIMIEYSYGDQPPLELDNLSIIPLPGNKTVSKFDLTLLGEDCGSVLRLEMGYATRLFRKETVNQFMQQIVATIEQVIVNPELPLSAINLSGVAVC